MKRLLPILAVLALLAPSASALGGQGVTILPNVVGAAVLGERVLLIHENATSTYIDIADVEIVSLELNAWGFPSVGYVGNPHTLTTTYESVFGEHTVITPCKGMSTARCVQKHADMLKEMQAVLVPK